MKAENKMKVIASLLLLLVPIVSQAQSCNSTGVDGAYSPTSSGVFDPVALNLNAAGDNVFNFTSVNIPAGVTITMQANYMKSQRPVVFLVSGAVKINGTLDLSGKNWLRQLEPVPKPHAIRTWPRWLSGWRRCDAKQPQSGPGAGPGGERFHPMADMDVRRPTLLRRAVAAAGAQQSDLR